MWKNRSTWRSFQPLNLDRSFTVKKLEESVADAQGHDGNWNVRQNERRTREDAEHVEQRDQELRQLNRQNIVDQTQFFRESINDSKKGNVSDPIHERARLHVPANRRDVKERHWRAQYFGQEWFVQSFRGRVREGDEQQEAEQIEEELARTWTRVDDGVWFEQQLVNWIYLLKIFFCPVLTSHFVEQSKRAVCALDLRGH